MSVDSPNTEIDTDAVERAESEIVTEHDGSIVHVPKALVRTACKALARLERDTDERPLIRARAHVIRTGLQKTLTDDWNPTYDPDQ